MMRALVVAAVLAGAGLAATAVAGDFMVVPADQLVWREMPDSHGVRAAVVYGDPSKPGIYVLRVRFPPHVMDRPHSHSQDRYVTVLEGQWAAGTGARFDPVAATPLPAGSFMFHPAGGVHWDGSNSDAPAVVQIIGMGPVTSTDVDPALPSWVKVGG
jgi:quercetin dioxygenase-like cupin family protein